MIRSKIFLKGQPKVEKPKKSSGGAMALPKPKQTRPVTLPKVWKKKDGE